MIGQLVGRDRKQIAFQRPRGVVVRQAGQEANKRFQAGTGVFEALTVERRMAPQIATGAGLGPERVDAERHHRQQKVDDENDEQLAALTVVDGAGGVVNVVHESMPPRK